MNGENTFFIVSYREVDAPQREIDVSRKDLLDVQNL
jgi:hypothetical protein